jgi:glycerophosphoryl diester phosphodiesterase
MKIFGHRGAPGFPRYGENTIYSFRKALDEGADGFEFDVRRCGDGTIVVVHDHTVDRTTNGTGRVAELSYEQLRVLDAGHGGPIPRLADVLELFGSRCILNIELKEKGLAAGVKDLVAAAGCSHNVIVSAFDTDDNDAASNSTWDELQLFHPEIRTALLATNFTISRLGIESFIDHACRLGATAVHPQRTAPIEELLPLARSAGLAVHVWTVNEQADFARFREMGVDAVFSDFPAHARV